MSNKVWDAGVSDLIITVSGDFEESVDFALKKANELLQSDSLSSIRERNIVFNSLSAAVERVPKANLDLISIPGAFVKREAMKALKLGLNLFIFSDNVPIEMDC